MKHITEGQAWKEYHARKGVPRPPLRSLKELSEELGVPVKTFSGKLKMEGAPKPVLSKSISGWGRSVLTITLPSLKNGGLAQQRRSDEEVIIKFVIRSWGCPS